MIEFGTKRSGGGKKSRLHKKFPRKKIDKVGEKVAGWFRSNWDDDSYPYFSGNLRKFLLSIGFITIIHQNSYRTTRDVIFME